MGTKFLQSPDGELIPVNISNQEAHGEETTATIMNRRGDIAEEISGRTRREIERKIAQRMENRDE